MALWFQFLCLLLMGRKWYLTGHEILRAGHRDVETLLDRDICGPCTSGDNAGDRQGPAQQD